MNLYQKKGEYDEMEYIAREALLEQLKAMESYNTSPMYRRGYDDCVEAILKAPAADVVPVVYCKDCKYADTERRNATEKRYFNSILFCRNSNLCDDEPLAMWPDDFCSYGERKDGGADND